MKLCIIVVGDLILIFCIFQLFPMNMLTIIRIVIFLNLMMWEYFLYQLSILCWDVHLIADSKGYQLSYITACTAWAACRQTQGFEMGRAPRGPAAPGITPVIAGASGISRRTQRRDQRRWPRWWMGPLRVTGQQLSGKWERSTGMICLWIQLCSAGEYCLYNCPAYEQILALKEKKSPSIAFCRNCG